MNKKLLSLIMSGAMLASACPAGVSAVPTGFKDSVKGSVVNAVKFVKNHKPAFAVGGTVIGTTVVAGAIAWSVHHYRDIVVDCTFGLDAVFRVALQRYCIERGNRVIINKVSMQTDNEINIINGVIDSLCSSYGGENSIEKIDKSQLSDDLKKSTVLNIIFTRNEKDRKITITYEKPKSITVTPM